MIYYSSQNENFPVPSDASRTPGDGHWAPHQPYTAIPAGSTRGYRFKPCDGVPSKNSFATNATSEYRVCG